MRTDNYIKGVTQTPLKIIEISGGDVLHAMRASDHDFINFGEAYFSTIEYNAIKAWKRHHQMTLNLIVPTGAVRFIMYDDRVNSATSGNFQEIILSTNKYYRLSVPPMVWMGFQGVGQNINMLLNIADIEHDDNEVDRMELHAIDYDWGL